MLEIIHEIHEIVKTCNFPFITSFVIQILVQHIYNYMVINV